MKPECLDGGDANDFELSQKCTLADIYNSMEHKRKLVIALIIKPTANFDRDLLKD